MELSEMKDLLKGYKRHEIEFGPHSSIRMTERELQEEEIIKNLLNPDKLIDLEEQPAKREGERKFKLIFEKSNTSSLIVIVVLKPSHKIKIPTVIHRMRKWHKVIKDRQKSLFGRL
ncbi:MAG: DUF4258 domain-containing protein [Candidatus Aenigmarchaeota archaeon]|nr:DUF4258 domain-containing protein [Candidatus Aenigmarchaeota archaeon]